MNKAMMGFFSNSNECLLVIGGIGIHMLPVFIEMPLHFGYKIYERVETQTTNQQQCNHGRWPEANVGQQYQKGLDCLVYQMLTVLATINPEKACCGISTQVYPHLPGLYI